MDLFDHDSVGLDEIDTHSICPYTRRGKDDYVTRRKGLGGLIDCKCPILLDCSGAMDKGSRNVDLISGWDWVGLCRISEREDFVAGKGQEELNLVGRVEKD